MITKLERGLIDSEKIGTVQQSDKSFAAPFYDKYIVTKDLGWLQCTQCGNGFEVTRQDVECGDVVGRQACDECGLGPMLVDWDYPDGPGWRAGV